MSVYELGVSAREQMAWQQMMSNTAHQREVEDLKAAGLNPVLSSGGTGASTPSGANDLAQLLSAVGESVGSSGKAVSKFVEEVPEILKNANDTVKEIAAAASRPKNIQGEGYLSNSLTPDMYYDEDQHKYVKDSRYAVPDSNNLRSAKEEYQKSVRSMPGLSKAEKLAAIAFSNIFYSKPIFQTLSELSSSKRAYGSKKSLEAIDWSAGI